MLFNKLLFQISTLSYVNSDFTNVKLFKPKNGYQDIWSKTNQIKKKKKTSPSLLSLLTSLNGQLTPIQIYQPTLHQQKNLNEKPTAETQIQSLNSIKR